MSSYLKCCILHHIYLQCITPWDRLFMSLLIRSRKEGIIHNFLFSLYSLIHMRYQADIELLDQHSAGLFMTNLAKCPRTKFLLVLHPFPPLCISNLHLPLECMIYSTYFYAPNSERLFQASISDFFHFRQVNIPLAVPIFPNWLQKKPALLENQNDPGISGQCTFTLHLLFSPMPRVKFTNWLNDFAFSL